MNRYDIHLCIVSGQPLPNLLPAFHPATRPVKVVLLVSDGMHEQAALLRQGFANLGCKTEEVRVGEGRIEDVRAAALEVLAGNDGRRIALNATGGTKVMAMGACDAFRELDYPAFYVDTEKRQLVTLYPQPGTASLPDVAAVGPLLAAYGYSVESKGSCRIRPEYRVLGKDLVENVERFAGALGVLNACAAQAKKHLTARLQTRGANPVVTELLQRFKAAGVLDVGNESIIFPSEEARFFANGGWLEDYVLTVVNRLKGQKIIRDHACNLKVKSRGGVLNEVDVAFAAANRLHLIECKTARMVDKNNREGRADQVAYKLEALRDLIGGTMARAMLVTYRNLTPEDRQRCHEYRIDVVEGGNIRTLYGHLQRWIDQPAGP